MPVYTYFAAAAAVFSFIGIILSLFCLLKVENLSVDVQEIKKPDEKLSEKIDTRLVNIMGHHPVAVPEPPVRANIGQRGVHAVLENTKDGSRKEKIIIDEVVIGRGHGCEIDTADFYVSGRHCRLIVYNGRLYIEDMHSTNGTFLNGRKITQRQEVSDKDMIALGNTRYLLHLR